MDTADVAVEDLGELLRDLFQVSGFGKVDLSCGLQRRMIREDIEAIKVTGVALDEGEAFWNPVSSLASLLAQKNLVGLGAAPDDVRD